MVWAYCNNQPVKTGSLLICLACLSTLCGRHGKKHTVMPTNINYRANIWALKEEGCTHVVVTTACGSLREEYKPGDLVFPDQFIDRTTKRVSTFYDGKEGSPSGICHMAMHEPYCRHVREVCVMFIFFEWWSWMMSAHVTNITMKHVALKLHFYIAWTQNILIKDSIFFTVFKSKFKEIKSHILSITLGSQLVSRRILVRMIFNIL